MSKQCSLPTLESWAIREKRNKNQQILSSFFADEFRMFSKWIFFFADSVYETLPLVQLPGKAVNHPLLGSRYCLYTYNIKEMCDWRLKVRPLTSQQSLALEGTMYPEHLFYILWNTSLLTSSLCMFYLMFHYFVQTSCFFESSAHVNTCSSALYLHPAFTTFLMPTPNPQTKKDLFI